MQWHAQQGKPQKTNHAQARLQYKHSVVLAPNQMKDWNPSNLPGSSAPLHSPVSVLPIGHLHLLLLRLLLLLGCPFCPLLLLVLSHQCLILVWCEGLGHKEAAAQVPNTPF